MNETLRHRRSLRRTIDLEQLQSDPASFLALGLHDPVLRKLESYRLYQAGYAAADIAQALDFARPYLYELWATLKTAGVAGLVDHRRGAAPRTRTPEREAQVLRAKALQPQRGDAELAAEFGLDRSTVYDLLKEHGLQDLHRVLTAAAPPAGAGPAAPPLPADPSAASHASVPAPAAKKGGPKASPAPTR
jgi:transposase